MSLPAGAPPRTPPSPDGPLRIGIFDNLANSAYIQAKMLRRLGQEADVVLDPLDRHVMSDPRLEELDIELPTDSLVAAVLPTCEIPAWVRAEPPQDTRARESGYLERYL